MSEERISEGQWSGGPLPDRVTAGRNTVINGEFTFKRFRARGDGGLVLGSDCTMDGVQFAVGESGRITIGDYCHFTNAVLLCEQEIRIGSYVLIGWNVTIADTDFHPIDPTLRIADAIACSPAGKGAARPAIDKRPILIEDDVYIGPAATILKGVTIGRGAWIEAGAVVTRDVPPASRVVGNPARNVNESMEVAQVGA